MRLRDFQQNLDKKFQSNINKITNLVEEVAGHLETPTPKAALNFALELLKPYLRSIDLRTSRLSPTHVEVIVPNKKKNLNENEEVDEGILLSSAIYAAELLWKKKQPEGGSTLRMTSAQIEILKPRKTHLRLRTELSLIAREAIFAELAEKNESHQDFTVQIYDAEDQIVGQIFLKITLHYQPVLKWK
ncbi:MAG: hypothetical protein BroJett040_12920 [Oligoflexia bacterium]|nr:MAG: hypothetical protein BroJett040_12920 [Oligoflexia bacterium]